MYICVLCLVPLTKYRGLRPTAPKCPPSLDRIGFFLGQFTYLFFLLLYLFFMSTQTIKVLGHDMLCLAERMTNAKGQAGLGPAKFLLCNKEGKPITRREDLTEAQLQMLQPETAIALRFLPAEGKVLVLLENGTLVKANLPGGEQARKNLLEEFSKVKKGLPVTLRNGKFYEAAEGKNVLGFVVCPDGGPRVSLAQFYGEKIVTLDIFQTDMVDSQRAKALGIDVTKLLAVAPPTTASVSEAEA